MSSNQTGSRWRELRDRSLRPARSLAMPSSERQASKAGIGIGHVAALVLCLSGCGSFFDDAPAPAWTLEADVPMDALTAVVVQQPAVGPSMSIVPHDTFVHTAPPPSGPTLGVSGTCTNGRVNVTADGMGIGVRVLLVRSRRNGSLQVPSGNCRGTRSELGGTPSLAAVTWTNVAGEASLPQLQVQCGDRLQLLDMSQCQFSNRVVVRQP